MNGVEYEPIRDFMSWMGQFFVESGVHGPIQCPDGSRGAVVRNPEDFTVAYVFREGLSDQEEADALELIVAKNLLFNKWSHPPHFEFNRKDQIRDLNVRLIPYLRDSYSVLLGLEDVD